MITHMKVVSCETKNGIELFLKFSNHQHNGCFIISAMSSKKQNPQLILNLRVKKI